MCHPPPSFRGLGSKEILSADFDISPKFAPEFVTSLEVVSGNMSAQQVHASRKGVGFSAAVTCRCVAIASPSPSGTGHAGCAEVRSARSPSSVCCISAVCRLSFGSDAHWRMIFRRVSRFSIFAIPPADPRPKFCYPPAPKRMGGMM